MIKNIDNTVIEKLAQVKVAAFNGPPWNDCWTQERAENSLYQLVCTPGFFGLYIVDQGEIAGYVLGVSETMCSSVDYELKELCIAPEYQRKQHGTRLMEALKQQLPEKGITEITLMTGNDKDINAFYLRNGFSQMRDITIYNIRL